MEVSYQRHAPVALAPGKNLLLPGEWEKGWQRAGLVALMKLGATNTHTYTHRYTTTVS